MITVQSSAHLSPELLSEHLLASVSILSETSDTLVELVESHWIVEELPSEGSLVVDEGDLLELVLTGGSSVELLWDGFAEVSIIRRTERPALTWNS